MPPIRPSETILPGPGDTGGDPFAPHRFRPRRSGLRASPGWRQLGRDSTSKGGYFELLLAADANPKSPGFGIVHAGLEDGQIRAFRSHHALARALGTHHVTMTRVLPRLVAASLIVLRNGVVVINEYRRLVAINIGG